MPQMSDPNFSGTITYICEHNEHGAMGIVINRPVQFSLSELLEQLEITFEGKEQAIYAGGPVQQDRGFVLHSCEPSNAEQRVENKPDSQEDKQNKEEWESTLQITPGIKLTTSKDILKAIAEGSGPNDFLIALGYAGWGEGQLEQELAENTWLCCPASASILFCPQNDKKMELAMAILGLDASQLNGQIGHA